MGERTAYEEGTFNWVDLATTDPAAAQVFYGRLVGWKPVERPMAGGHMYTVLHRDKQEVAGLYALGEVERADGAACWNSYVSVGDVDAAAARAIE